MPTLRRRFEAGSPDAVGLDPLASAKPKEARETREELAKAAAAMMPRNGGGVTYDPSGLDKILDGIEKEHGRIDEGPISSELSELFALMDSAPKRRATKAAPARPDKNNRFAALSSPDRKAPPPPKRESSDGGSGASDDDDDWRRSRAARKTNKA